MPLATVVLNRMAGSWYLVATIPNFLERGVIAGSDVFTPQSATEIREDFSMNEGGFESKRRHFTTTITILPDTGSADWRVHILGPITLPFQVLYVDPNYKYALFGEQNRRWGWVYSRDQIVPDEDYLRLLAHFKDRGYDTSQFRKFVQIPAHIGQPGYWSDGIQ